MPERTVVLHYHLFKNGGTSIDSILRANFGEAWITKEFSTAGDDNSKEVADWIQSEPYAVAFSSHTMVGPIPKIPGVRILSLVNLRDPVSRIYSAYRFEREQKVETFGAILARHTTFEGYVRCRLALPHDRQCRDFQTGRLATASKGQGSELDRASRGLEQFDIVGRVEQFDETLNLMHEMLAHYFPDIQVENLHHNKSNQNQQEIPADLLQLLHDNNQNDLDLLNHHDRLRISNCGLPRRSFV